MITNKKKELEGHNNTVYLRVITNTCRIMSVSVVTGKIDSPYSLTCKIYSLPDDS